MKMLLKSIISSKCRTLIAVLTGIFKKKNSGKSYADSADTEEITDSIENVLVIMIEDYLRILATDSNQVKDPSWVVFHRFYNSLTDDQKTDFKGALQHIIIETTSTVLNTITTHGQPDYEVKIISPNGYEIQNYLCDSFIGRYSETCRFPQIDTPTKSNE